MPQWFRGGSESSSEFEIDAEECKARDAKSRAKEERKKAGLPELELDQLPSTIAPKMLNLRLKKENMQFFITPGNHHQHNIMAFLFEPATFVLT